MNRKSFGSAGKLNPTAARLTFTYAAQQRAAIEEY
jgi:hypothetical protein